MKAFITLFTSFLLFTSVLSGQAGMTVVLDSPCLGTITMTYSGTDATGRHIYGDETFNGVGNPVFSIFWDQASGSWFVGLLGTGTPSDILYTTGPNAFSPNPPDSATETYTATVIGGCSGLGDGTATVSGSGTQTTSGTPCDGIGDDDGDGICNNNDVCPGEDDTIDGDGDNIPDCNDPNPGVFDGVSFDSPCLGGVIVFTLSGNDGTRNTYANAAQGLEIEFDVTDNRWEMRGANAGGGVIYFNTLASIPNPPSTTAMAWEGVSENGCSDAPPVGGSGTQDARCTEVCDDSDPCTMDTQDVDCICTSSPDAEAPVLAGCPADAQEGVDDGTCMFETPDYTPLITVTDNCTTSTPTLLQIPAAGTMLGSGIFEIKLVATDLEGNPSDTCRITLNNIDNVAPTLECVTTFNVELDANGAGEITDAALLINTLSDNCTAEANINITLTSPMLDCDDLTTASPDFFFLTEVAGETGPATGSGTNAALLTIGNCDCPTGYVAVGYSGRSGVILDQFSLVCAELMTDGTLGTNLVTTCSEGGSTGGNPFGPITNASGALVGMETWITNFEGNRHLKTIEGRSQTPTYIADGGSNSSSPTIVTQAPPGPEGAVTDIFVPDGAAIVGMEVFSTGFATEYRLRYAFIQKAAIAPAIVEVTDASGNSDRCVVQLTVEDNIAPTFDCTDINVDLDAAGEYFITDEDVFDRMVQNWVDNCAPVPISFGSGDRAITCDNITNGTFPFFFEARDGNGQEALCTSIITVNDPTLACDDAPVAVCLATAIIQIDADGNAGASSINNGSTDDNTLPADLIFSIDGDVLACNDVGEPAQMVTLIVTDNVGQTATCTSMVTVEDNIAPEVTCQNIAVDLNASGSFSLSNQAGIDNILTSFTDNCATEPDGILTGFQFTFGCGDLGINNEGYFFRDRPNNDPTRLEDRCDVLIQINDPLGVCATPPTLTCTDFRDYLADGKTTYNLSASDVLASSSDDQGVYAIVFDDEQTTIGQTSTNFDFNNVGHGQSFTAPQTGNIQTIKVRFAAAKSNAILYLYNSGTGSGTAGSIGTPAYTQTGIELFAGPTGALTEILLDSPFPVVQGQQYSFVFDEFTHPYYTNDATAYPGGDFIFNYDLSSGCCDFADMVFEIDFIGSTEVDLAPGVYVASTFAVDIYGTYSTGCDANVTIDAACTPGTFTQAPVPAVDGYCTEETVTLTATAELNDSEAINWYMGTCADGTLTGASSAAFLGTGGSISLQFPDIGQDVTIVSIIQGPDGCGDGECVTTTLLREVVSPTLFTMNAIKELDVDGMAILLPEDVFDEANSFDNCAPTSRSIAPSVVPVSVTPNTFTVADLGPNAVTLTARDNFGNTTTEISVVTITLAALPVEWLSFSANAGAKKVDLQWETSEEPDNAGFHIERSANGRAWSVIGEQAPLAGDAYDYTDATPLNGDNYYRIRQTDHDGTVSFSPVEIVTFTGNLAGLLIAPNPATDEFTVRIPAKFGEDAQLQLVNITGRTIQLPSSPTESGIRFDVGQLARGVYLLRAVSKDGKVTETVRVVLQ